jgi:hypothetical protein
MTHHTRHWEDFRDTYRSDWEASNPNRTWDAFEPGYRYGWESAQDERFRSHSSFMDAENDLRSGWSDYDRNYRGESTATQMERNWEDFKDSVRHGWERAKQEFRETF